MKSETKRDIRSALRTIAENHAATMAVLERMLNDLAAQLDGERTSTAAPSSRHIKRDPYVPYIDWPMLSVVHRGRRCFLGDTFPFRLIAKLIGHPNRFFSYDELLGDVWDSVRSRTAVRSVVKVLRAKLRRSRLHELAEAIDGSVKRHYGLMLNRMGR